jgi:hypothetical protein
MPRPAKPDFLVQYEEWVRAGPPQCCHNCISYSMDGRCYVFDMEPPADFVNSAGQCDKWEREVPF